MTIEDAISYVNSLPDSNPARLLLKEIKLRDEWCDWAQAEIRRLEIENRILKRKAR